LDFYRDLEKYYQCGTDLRLTYEMASPLLADILRSMKNAISRHHPHPHHHDSIVLPPHDRRLHGHFRFAHAETILPLVCLLGICSNVKLRASFSNYEQKTRHFQTAALSPMAANLVFRVYACGKRNSLSHASSTSFDHEDEDDRRGRRGHGANNTTTTTTTATTHGIQKEDEYSFFTHVQLFLNEQRVSLPFCRHPEYCTLAELNVHFEQALQYDFRRACRLNQSSILPIDE
jgi:hypothetical protein